jgi:hypothetical protein
LAVLSIFVLACGGEKSAQSTDGRLLYERLGSLFSSASFAPPIYRSAIEAAPATTFVVDGERTMTASDAFAVGTVQSLAGVAAWSFAAGPNVADGPSAVRQLPFNDPGADIDVAAVTLRVERFATAAGGVQPDTVSFGLSLPSPTNLPALEQQLKGAGRIAVLLESNEKTPFDFDRSLYGVVGYGAFLGTVDNDEVTFGDLTPSPFGFAKEVVTIDAILKGAGTIALREVNGLLERV